MRTNSNNREATLKRCILIADDEPLNRMVLRDILEEDYDVLVAENGQQAVELACGNPVPDIIMLDVRMPVMDGYLTCKYLKKNKKTKDIPVIFLTVLNDEENEHKGLTLGGVDYIIKPLRPSIVKARLATHLRLKETREKLAQRNAELEEMLSLRESVEQITKHDLKTPLIGIIGAAQLLLLEDYIEKDHKELLVLQEKSAFKMLEMINRSMDILKMEQGKYQLNAVDVDIVPIIHRIIAEIKHDNVEFLLNGRPIVVSDDGFVIQGEELLCYSMLANLIKNAVEASTPQEKITIALSEEKPHPSIMIQNPKMVPDEIRDHFFEKFASSGKKEGTGLGTYSAKLIAETLGGKIEMKTAEEEGTQIIVSLPA